MVGKRIEGRTLVIVSILRAGNGLLDGMLELIPAAKVGHIGLYRDPETKNPIQYYCKLPEDMHNRDVIIVDPMIATGNSAVAAVERVKATRPRSIKFVSLIACPEGIKVFHTAHPEVILYTAAVDERLNDHAYIVPGLGDAGDRLYGTK
jgi:uracil phosphoribosyltransferase